MLSRMTQGSNRAGLNLDFVRQIGYVHGDRWSLRLGDRPRSFHRTQ